MPLGVFNPPSGPLCPRHFLVSPPCSWSPISSDNPICPVDPSGHRDLDHLTSREGLGVGGISCLWFLGEVSDDPLVLMMFVWLWMLINLWMMIYDMVLDFYWLLCQQKWNGISWKIWILLPSHVLMLQEIDKNYPKNMSISALSARIPVYPNWTRT